MLARISLAACLAVGLLLALGPRVAVAAEPVTLASQGEAKLPVIVADDASETVREAADALAANLSRITGAAAFAVEVGDGQSGIVVGTATSFADLVEPGVLNSDELFRGDDYVIRTHDQGVHLIGARGSGAQHAVWDFLHRLGYRQYFPGETWEIVPDEPELAVTFDVVERPSYITRNIWLQWGAGAWRNEAYEQWRVRNRLLSGFRVYNHHMYQAVIQTYREAFDEHPEYLGLVDGERKSSKLCLSNPAVRGLVADFVVEWFEKNPEAPVASIEPSDWAGWCECEPCTAMGSPSTRATLLANEVAELVSERVGEGRYLGMLAYHNHADPPEVALDPRVILTVTTGLRHTQLTVEESIDAWRDQGAEHLGIYDYFSVGQWWRDMPGRMNAADLERHRRQLTGWHRQGLRFFDAESGDNFGPSGLGYYVATRLLWNLDAADEVEAIVEEFLHTAFGVAAEPMRRFYGQLDASHRDVQRRDHLGQMYRALHDAWELAAEADDPAVRQRLIDLAGYMHYVDLFRDYRDAEGDARQAHFEALMRHLFRTRHTGMNHTMAFQTLTQDQAIDWPEEARMFAPLDSNPWMSDEPVTPAEAEQWLTEGVARHDVLPFEDVRFSDNLVPATPLGLEEVELGHMYHLNRWDQPYHIWVPEGQERIELGVGGTNRLGRLYARAAGESPIARFEINEPIDAGELPEGDAYAVTLETDYAGLHTLVISEGTGGVALAWEEGLRVTQPMGNRSWWGYQTLYFYVPKGTPRVAGDAGARGRIVSPDGEVRYEKLPDPDARPGDAPEVFDIDVEPGQDGRLWKLEQFSGAWLMRTVPPYLARNGDELLLPAEVVERDAAE